MAEELIQCMCTVAETNYTVFRKKTPTHIFFHISMRDV